MSSSLRLLHLPSDDKENLWDATLVDDAESMLCSHAMAQGTTVYGSGTSHDSDNEWISWQTTLDHTVGRLCSNKDGSIVVASTLAGTVSLLSGKDGSLLATRMVSKSQGVAHIEFVSGASTTDTLVIVVPEDLESSSSSSGSTQVILVSTIDGRAFHDETTMAEATRNMAIGALVLPVPHVSHVKAVTIGVGRLRFAVVTSEGKLLLYDYATDSKQLTALADNNDFTIQVSAGMTVQYHEPSNSAYFVFILANKKKPSAIVWYSTSQLSIVCQMDLKNKTVALCPLTSCSHEALSIAVATKDDIQVAQVCVDETMGLVILQNPHVLYTIPMTCNYMASIGEAYSFRFCDKGNMIREFTARSPLVGRIRLLLYQDRFEEAETTAQEAPSSDDDYSHFHSTELFLCRLHHTLNKPASSDTMHIAQHCLQRLVQLNGSNLAVDNLLAAANAILNWQAPTVVAYRMALASMSQTLQAVQAPSVATERLYKKKVQLDNAILAMQALLELLQNEDGPLEGNFAQVRSMSDLFKVLLSEGLFGAAQTLLRSTKLTPELVVSAMISLSPTDNPRLYVPLLESGILGLSVKHTLLPTICAWACRTADALVSNSDLESAIFLLQHVHNAMNQLQARIYSSFASFCPFVDVTLRPRQASPRNADNTANSFNSFRSNDSTTYSSIKTNSIDQPVPTILELGKLKGGAVKSHQLVRSNDVDDDDCDDIEVKLRHAKVLQKARGLGVDGADLRHFVRKGGAVYLARELVRLFSRNATSHESRFEIFQTKIRPFCDESDVCFDEVLVAHGDEVCESKHMSQSMLMEASSLARCCVKDSMKCKITLTVLRASLLCGAATPCLTTLSKDAIHWAGGDLAMRSELTEATRLLVISSIAVTYCGTDAALELFRVDNPSHAVKLLSHVCRHITYPEALSDALKLCDAFTQVTKEDACIQMLEMSILCGSVEVCTKVMTEIFDKEMSVAQSIWTRALEFCSMTLLDTCETMRACKFRTSERNQATLLCSKALALLEVVQERLPARLLKATPFESLLDSYQRVTRLQSHHDIFASPLELDCRQVQLRIVRYLVASIREKFGDGDKDTLSLFEEARRAAQLLVGVDDVSSVWFSAVEHEACQLVWSADDGMCVQFLVQSGTLNNLSNNEAAQAVLSVVLNYCKRASKGAHELNDRNIVSQMKLVLRASQLLHDYVLVGCPPKLLSTVSALSSLTETIGRVLLMADNGVGDELESHRRQLRLWNCNVTENPKGSTSNLQGVFKKPFLHSSWYVGDGLLLPLDETHGSCVEFCMDLVGLILCNQSPNLRGSEKLHSLLDERGAHSAALRVGCLTMANVLSSSVFRPVENYQNLISFSSSYQITLKSLAERSLGGSGNGITNPKVDSGLALSYLHLLPTKLAFQVYKTSLPSAVTKRDFKRVLTLSNIGVVAGKGLPLRSDFVPSSWKKQGKFVEQCERLSMRACWWIALQRFQVDFEPRRFEESSGSDPSTIEGSNDARKETQYAATLLDPLVANCCEEFQNADMARKVAFTFAAAFGVEKQLAAQKHVEFLLSCPPIERELTGDLRFDLFSCEKAVRVSLNQITSPMKRAALLRKALVGLEGNKDFSVDYERHSLLLSLYHEELATAVESDAIKKKIDIKPFVEELESIERRRDTLSVLMSFFEGEQRVFRPNFPKFFTALPIVFGLDAGGKELPRMGVLGPIQPSAGNAFDPLGPLQDFLSTHADASTATALAPLCVPLNLSHGYVHARTLVSRFQQSSLSGGAQPSLETDVLPVLNRLKSSKDQSILTEWCASMYQESDEQKMRCLDIALEHAMKASSEIEQRASHEKSSDLASEEQEALERVRRISSEKSILSDKNQVNQILLMSKYGDADHFRAAKKMIDDLTTRLNEDLWNRADAAPDKFVELFLTESSAIASTACLAMGDSFALDHLRYMATVVHKACKEISEQYSHVHAGALCRKLARRWLVHGDSASASSEPTKMKARAVPTFSFDEDEDETIDFVMDLSQIGDDDRMWSDDVGSALPGQREESLVTREEEPSALDVRGSAREVSEFDCAKVALRIAFVMSFADGYHPKAPESPRAETENTGDSNNRSFTRDVLKKKRRGLLSRIPVGESNHDSVVMEHGRELLRIVFAKSGGTKERNDPSLSFLSTTGNDLGVKAATFAMRYRALRTAAILCPQEALERIIKDEGFLQNSNGDASCTLRQCTFGAFVAKEIEEMGLVLPHSDLAQLSTMQFSSYARALRRNHDTNSLKTKGRLLLLLIEMSTVSDQSWDQQFVTSVLSEMRQLHLPRSLLHASERYIDFVGGSSSEMKVDSRVDIAGCVSVLVEACLKEAHTSLSERGTRTLSRLVALVQKLHDTQPELVRSFTEGLSDVLSSTKEEKIQTELAELVATFGTAEAKLTESSTATGDAGTLKGRLATLSCS